jgi:Tfp pilus assembly PilM family ATPase
MLNSPNFQSFGRRYAVGLDLTPRVVRLVILSRRCASRAVRVETFDAEASLAEAIGDAAAGSRAVAHALDLVLSRALRGRARAAGCAVMAVPGSELVSGALPLGRSATPGWLATGLREAAERAAGQAADTLMLDWRVLDPADSEPASANQSRVEFVATPQDHLDARIEAAAAAGLHLRAIDAEPAAALRAVRYLAAITAGVPGHSAEAYFALWINGDGVYGWYVAHDRVKARVGYPSAKYACLADAVRALASHGGARRAWLAGELDLLVHTGLAPCDIADLLGCSLSSFACDELPAQAGAGSVAHLRAPAFAVAFGLALRGVFQ